MPMGCYRRFEQHLIYELSLLSSHLRHEGPIASGNFASARDCSAPRANSGAQCPDRGARVNSRLSVDMVMKQQLDVDKVIIHLLEVGKKKHDKQVSIRDPDFLSYDTDDSKKPIITRGEEKSWIKSLSLRDNTKKTRKPPTLQSLPAIELREHRSLTLKSKQQQPTLDSNG
ncbi:unnamed protein product [Nezara viridula]|uniref:Uncharacterized protein n=1 Tax=Nezara viridula TaxID=85310 RepID=A0A9P0HDL9_NEZVI|nr:unnamed protein product [Nezara viridula]